jgi:hypothetical protein
MFPLERQSKLDPILTGLRSLPGITAVQQDDFDSNAIDVIISLKMINKCKLEVGLRSMKSAIVKVVDAFGYPCNILDWPAKRYSYNGKDHTGKSIMFDEGYDHNTIKLEIRV